MEQPTADSLFVCAENISSGSYISSSKGMLSRYELTTAELMGNRNTSFVVGNEKRPVLRTSYRLALLLFLTGLLLLRMSDLQTATETACASETHYFALLLNYIHSQDGKKKFSLILFI